jgi:uncharacterized membrane protein YwaF
MLFVGAVQALLTPALGYNYPHFRFFEFFTAHIAISATGGNYMFLARKPDTPSLLDYLGTYPWYLLSLDGVAVVFFLLLYLPFIVFRPSNAKRQV